MQPRPRCRTALLALVGLLAAGAGPVVRAQQSVSAEIRPPFGLGWGESASRLDGLLAAAKASVVERRLVGARECWVVEGLEQPNLKRTLFYFAGGTLAEVELQYQNRDWQATQYEAFLSQVRTRIEQRYGTGKLIARSKAPEKEVMQTVIGYQWNQPGTALQIFYYSAEAGVRSWRTVSLHYKRT